MTTPHDTLIGRRIDVLDKGWIELQDLMGDDLAIVNAARVSFLGESKGPDRDKALLFYLMEHRHTSPFEQVEFKFRCRAPLVVWWQWVRHRTWHVNAQCLDGDTEIIFDKPEQRAKDRFRVGSKIKISDLYRRWQTWEKTRIREMHLRTVDEETMLLSTAHVGDVLYAGEKDAFCVTTSNGRQIVCSAEHRFLFENGWQSLQEAAGLRLVKDRAVWSQLPHIYVNGKPLATSYLYTDAEWLKYQYHICQRSINEIAQLAKCSSHTVRKYLTKYGLTLPERSQQSCFRPGQKPWNKGLNYSLNETLEENLARRERAQTSVRRGEECHFWRGGSSTNRQNIGRWTTDVAPYIFTRDQYICAYCGEHIAWDGKPHAHHIIPVWADESKAYDVDNLITLHESRHHYIHANHLELEFARKLDKGISFDPEQRPSPKLLPNSHATPRLVEITQIEYVGKREMYDLVVDGPYPNFVANWFVVHNSGRYSAFQEDDFYVPTTWRLQAADNKQGSQGELSGPEADALTGKLLAHIEQSFALYQEALKAGVAREIARLFLPGFAAYYTWVLKVDAHNLMHFLRLRLAPDAQYEIRAYAWAIYEHFFKPALPWTAEAFEATILPTPGPRRSSSA
ncbi:MAG: FAD-dependent thymidylate synthase [Anaerolineae bacterium]|nr:FAD-dependent thymidylate synthase [Anaerolineae bacterium]